MDRNELYSFIDQDNSSERYDDLLELADGGPVGEDMQSEVEPSVQYFADGGMATMPIPERPTRMSAAQMLRRYADGGLVGERTKSEQEEIFKQFGGGAAVENLYGSNVGMPKVDTTPMKFNFDIPTITSTYTPPTGPVGATTLADFPSGLGTQPSLTFAGSQQAPAAGTAKSLFEQITPASLGAKPATFNLSSGYTPTVQTFAKPELISTEEAILDQPKLVRYEPDLFYGGLTTYKGPINVSPSTAEQAATTGGATTGGTTTGGTTTGSALTGGATTGGTTAGTTLPPGTIDPRSYNFVPPTTGTTYSPNSSLWVNPTLGVSFFSPTGGYKAPGTGWIEYTDYLNQGLYGQDTATAGAGTDTVTAGPGIDTTVAGTGIDTTVAGAGVDTVTGGAGGTTITGTGPGTVTQGVTTVTGAGPGSTVSGASGEDILAGGTGVIGPKPTTPTISYKSQIYGGLTPEMLSALSGRASDVKALSSSFKNIVDMQQADVTALEQEYDAAIKRGDVAAMNVISPVLSAQRQELATSKADLAFLPKLFTGANKTFETPEQYQTRLTQQFYVGADKKPRELAAYEMPTADWTAVNTKTGLLANNPMAKGGAFAQAVTTQDLDVKNATNVYNAMVKSYGKDSPAAKNFFDTVLKPQQDELAQINTVRKNAASAYELINAQLTENKKDVYKKPVIKITNKTTEGSINKSFNKIFQDYNTSIESLNRAKEAATAAGLTDYVTQVDGLLKIEQDKLATATADRDAYLKSLPVKKAMGSGPEGEYADPVMALMERQRARRGSGPKDQGSARARLKKFLGGEDLTPEGYAHGGLVHRAEGSPVYGEMPDTGGITPDTMAALLNKRGVNASEVLRTLKDIYGQGVSNLESGLRGSVAAIPGSVGDIESIFRDSDKTRKFATTEEVLRDYMPKRMTKPTKEAAGFEELGTYLPLPVPAGTATKVVKGAKKGAKKTLEELGPTVASMAERQLQRSGLGPMYAVKPGGGTFFPPGYGSRLDDYLDRVVKDLSSSETLTGKDAQSAADFIRTKGRKYFTGEFGTAKDTLRNAVLEGRLPLYGSDKERFRKYLLKAAESGDPEALQDLEKFYDTATGIDPITYVSPERAGKSFEIANKAQREMRERMSAEGVEPEFMNSYYPSPITKETLEASYSTESRKNLAGLMRMLENASTPEEKQALLNSLGGDLKSLAYAAEKGEPIYDFSGSSFDFLNTRNLAQGIASIPAKERQNMSFPEAVIKGAQNMRLKRDWESVIKNAEAGKVVPKEIFFQGTQPVYEIGKDQKWVRIMTPDAVELEGAAMRHSVGGYKTKKDYGQGGKEGFTSGRARVFSLRNEKGVPQVTVESKFTDDMGLEITQIKSKFNSMPTPEEKKAVFELFDTLGPTSFRSDTYSSTRTGDRLEESKTIDWGNEYQDYLKYKNKGEE